MASEALEARPTSLARACADGNTAVVKSLLAAKANVNEADQDGAVPVLAACENGSCQFYVVFDSVILFAVIAVIVIAFCWWWWSHWYVMTTNASGNERVVELLLECKADANHADANGSTALSMTCSRGHEAIARLLLTHGVQVDWADSEVVGFLRQINAACVEEREAKAGAEAEIGLADEAPQATKEEALEESVAAQEPVRRLRRSTLRDSTLSSGSTATVQCSTPPITAIECAQTPLYCRIAHNAFLPGWLAQQSFLERVPPPVECFPRKEGLLCPYCLRGPQRVCACLTEFDL